MPDMGCCYIIRKITIIPTGKITRQEGFVGTPAIRLLFTYFFNL
jgi:hypothetical protein